MRFPKRLAVLCYALSLSAHAGVLAWLASTPVPPASPWAGRSGAVSEQAERHVVQVTFTMSMTDFAKLHAEPTPVDLESEPLPEDAPPLVEVDAPAVDSGLPEGADPSDVVSKHAPAKGEDEPTSGPVIRPAAGLPAAELALEPMPIEPIALEAVSPVEPVQVALDDTLRELEELAVAEQVSVELPEQPAEPTEPNESSEQTAEAEPEQQPAEPEATTAQAPPTGPSAPGNPQQTADADRDSDAADTVFDESSVDRPITFKHMARPEPSSVSRRLGDAGTIAIMVEVGTDGGLLHYKVVDDAGMPRLLAAAIDALKASDFNPAEVDGKPVRSTRLIEYRF